MWDNTGKILNVGPFSQLIQLFFVGFHHFNLEAKENKFWFVENYKKSDLRWISVNHVRSHCRRCKQIDISVFQSEEPSSILCCLTYPTNRWKLLSSKDDKSNPQKTHNDAVYLFRSNCNSDNQSLELG